MRPNKGSNVALVALISLVGLVAGAAKAGAVLGTVAFYPIYDAVGFLALVLITAGTLLLAFGAAVLAYISLKGRGASDAQRSAYSKLDDKT